MHAHCENGLNNHVCWTCIQRKYSLPVSASVICSKLLHQLTAFQFCITCKFTGNTLCPLTRTLRKYWYWFQSQALQHTSSSRSPAGFCVTYHNHLTAAAHFSPPHSLLSQCFVSLSMRMLQETKSLAKVNTRSTPCSPHIHQDSHLIKEGIQVGYVAFLFINLCWLCPSTFLIFMYLQMFSRLICFTTFLRIKVKLTAL